MGGVVHKGAPPHFWGGSCMGWDRLLKTGKPHKLWDCRPGSEATSPKRRGDQEGVGSEGMGAPKAVPYWRRKYSLRVRISAISCSFFSMAALKKVRMV